MPSVILKLKIDVVPVDRDRDWPQTDPLLSAVKMAVYNALDTAEDAGFEHPLSDVLSLRVDDVSILDYVRTP